MKRPLLFGFLLWAAGTLLLRLAGQHLLRAPGTITTLIQYFVSFLLMAVLIPRICRRLNLAGDSAFQAVTLLILPTLLLDAFSSAFFSIAFPNIDPAAAGAFGGWMLICCAGAVVGVWVSERRSRGSKTK